VFLTFLPFLPFLPFCMLDNQLHMPYILNSFCSQITH
jgi:hypothetical protein